ncbi:hypothetical protein EJO68_10185 [Variovorax atrisoli]|uniref:hypothetical protein n=1 Tax=Variovorax atrisoli TaxID=3394203 RepID=UPI000F7D6881|nr:hypothetical protein [Variovorax sp. 369]RTD94166.1 hypothetical protein EJO68_10185 [Variovorax sp. 369]
MNVLAINFMLTALMTYMGTGAKFKIYAGVKPGAGGAETTLLASAILADPEGVVSGGMLVLAQADSAGDIAVGTGVATWGRLETADGVWVEDFTVSGPSGGGQVKITTVDPAPGDPEAQIYAGGTFLLGTVILGA